MTEGQEDARWPGQLVFPAGNDIPYGQDFAWRRGVPAGRAFTVFAAWQDKVVLRAPGYGEPGQYGNEALYVHKGDIPGAVCIRVDGRPVWRWVGGHGVTGA
jgi:hypothetical protein